MSDVIDRLRAILPVQVKVPSLQRIVTPQGRRAGIMQADCVEVDPNDVIEACKAAIAANPAAVKNPIVMAQLKGHTEAVAAHAQGCQVCMQASCLQHILNLIPVTAAAVLPAVPTVEAPPPAVEVPAPAPPE